MTLLKKAVEDRRRFIICQMQSPNHPVTKLEGMTLSELERLYIEFRYNKINKVQLQVK